MANVFLEDILPGACCRIGWLEREPSDDFDFEEFGADFGGYQDFWITYYGTALLQTNGFSYWNPSNPLVSSWIVNGQDIGAGNQQHIPLSMVGNVSLHVGNDICPLVFITIPISTDVIPWDVNFDYRLNVVAPVPHEPNGREQ